MTRRLLSFLEYCNNFKAVSIYPYSLLTSYFLSQILSYNSSKHCYKISLSLSFCESSQASHCLQNKVPIPFGWHSTIRSQYGTLVIHTYTTHYSNSITITVPEYSMDNDYLIEKEMATHSSSLDWQMQWTEEPGGLQSMGLKKSQT